MLEKLHDVLWGAPMLVLILAAGLFLTGYLRLPQLRLLPALKALTSREIRGGEMTPFASFCTALGATVGTGNVVGVAGAICIGGPGAVFWMWVCGFLGMATKFAEATLAIRFQGRWGGPMQYMTLGLGPKWHPVATAYSVFGIIAAFGVGSAVQSNAMVVSISSGLGFLGIRPFRELPWLVGGIGAALLLIVLLGGAKRIGKLAESLVPAASGIYVLLCLWAIARGAGRLPYAFRQIFQGAFSPGAVTGGSLGSAFLALRTGAARGVFSNEAGMGTAAIAHGASGTDCPVEQGMLGVLEVFVDTMVICTLTALTVLCSGIPIPYGHERGAEIAADAFSVTLGGWMAPVLGLLLCIFCFATVIGWGLYGIRFSQFVFGQRAWIPFLILQALSVAAGAVVKPGMVWVFAEICNALLALPNLAALFALSPMLRQLVIEYTNKNSRK